jgi:hypothetical protein
VLEFIIVPFCLIFIFLYFILLKPILNPISEETKFTHCILLNKTSSHYYFVHFSFCSMVLSWTMISSLQFKLLLFLVYFIDIILNKKKLFTIITWWIICRFFYFVEIFIVLYGSYKTNIKWLYIISHSYVLIYIGI